jgi:3-deoxy-manno-octulosonate cytidylyltransferase (CMP-KDO synthetase)
MSKHIVGIIPARMASSRFPGKPLAPILGIPMLGHVWARSKLSLILDEVYVATPDDAIRKYIDHVGGKTVMTADTHTRASDRCAEAMLKIEEETGNQINILVMIQGDEPLLHPDMIQEAVDPLLQDETVRVTNLLGRINSNEDHDNPNEIKVVVDQSYNALYLSREPIPTRKKSDAIPMHKQVCIIPFRRQALLQFTDLSPTPLEIIESIDMLRFLEHGLDVRMVPTDYQVQSVDTEIDRSKVEEIMVSDPLYREYSTQFS